MTRKLSIILAAAFVIGAVPGLTFAEPSGLGRIHSDAGLYHSGFTWKSTPDWNQRNFGTETLVYNHDTGQYEIVYGLSDAPRENMAEVAQAGPETIRTEQRTYSSQQQVVNPSASSQSGMSSSYGPAGTGAIDMNDYAGSNFSAEAPSAGADVSAGLGVAAPSNAADLSNDYSLYSEDITPERSLIAAQSPETMEADQWPLAAGSFASSEFGPSGTGAVGSSSMESSSSSTSEYSSNWSSSEAVGTGALPAPSFRNAVPSREDVETGNAPLDDLDTFYNPFYPNERGIDIQGNGGDGS